MSKQENNKKKEKITFPAAAEPKIAILIWSELRKQEVNSFSSCCFFFSTVSNISEYISLFFSLFFAFSFFVFLIEIIIIINIFSQSYFSRNATNTRALVPGNAVLKINASLVPSA